MSKFIKLLIFGLFSFWMGGHVASASGEADRDVAGRDSAVEHRLMVILDPDQRRLSARDHILFRSPDTALELDLAGHLSIHSIAIGGVPADFTRKNHRLRIGLKRHQVGAEIVLTYSGIFDDNAPVQPLNTDNPGYGVTGTIDERGTMILAGAGWYPRAVGVSNRYELRVNAPEGVIAVTAGTPGEIVTAEGRTTSHWSADGKMRGLPLVAGPYVVTQKRYGSVTAATYFSADLQHLSQGYLESTGRYIQRYEALFGPYPYSQFAVVENFFPTGYGFPSFTLLGRSVLQLPFIRHTSLGHEIAHCWWGNGVLVDAGQGNWSEALTSYVADYLFKEWSGKGEAHRHQWLQNYASLVEPSSDFPLSQFSHRTDPVTRVVGYDKGAMVFHMLRRTVGEEHFWATLRQVYHQYRFRAIDWSDLQEAFERQSGQSLGTFFEQWVFRRGAPVITMTDVAVAPSTQGYRITGKILQEPPYFRFQLDLKLETEKASIVKRVTIEDGQTAFALNAPQAPISIAVDPDNHLFRRLAPEEVPSSINALKRAGSVRVVVANRLGERGLSIARRLMTGLGLRDAVLQFEDEYRSDQLDHADLLIVGQPDQKDLIRDDQDRFRFTSSGFELSGQTYTSPKMSFFGVFDHPSPKGRVTALYLPGEAASDNSVSAKIPHYGRYSYLVFEGIQNRVKGTWLAGSSPLVVSWHGSHSVPK